MRTRTQYNYSEEQLRELYQGYDTNKWLDHRMRVDISAGMIDSVCREWGLVTIADLSCGDGRILAKVSRDRAMFVQAGDYAPANVDNLPAEWNPKYGSIEQTINEIAPVEMFILSETLEHLEDPDRVLRDIAVKTKFLFVSTPLDETPGVNPEHYWAWNDKDVRDMLYAAGFSQTVFYSEINFYVARYQIWMVSK